MRLPDISLKIRLWEVRANGNVMEAVWHIPYPQVLLSAMRHALTSTHSTNPHVRMQASEAYSSSRIRA